MATAPYNLRKQNDAPEAIATAVDYALQVAGHYVTWLTRVWDSPADPIRPLAGRRILELGPGPTLGSAVLLACAGARMSVADRFLSQWDPAFHGPFYAELLRRVLDRGPAYVEPIRRILAVGQFEPVLQCYPFGAEQITRIDGQFDGVLSNAVLEHVEDIHATALNLSAKTAPGGLGFHQVDFRDHRNFDRPLEYLTLDAPTFEALRSECHCECGARWRMSDVALAFETVGFSVRASANMFATPEYLADVRPRLHPEFADLDDTELAAISGLFSVTRQGAPEPRTVPAEFYQEASDGVTGIARQIEALVVSFRGDRLQEANDGLVELSNELRQFAILVEVLRGPLAVAPDRLMVEGMPPDVQLSRLEGQLTEIVEAQRNHDWVTIADVLELDLLPVVRAWAPRLLELRG